MWPVVYFALALVCCLSVWRDHELRVVGAMLLVGWALTNMANCGFAPSERPAAFTVIEIMLSLVAYFAYLAGRSRLLLVLLAVSATSCASNVAIAAIAQPDTHQVVLWQTLTNVCFGLECLLVFASGVRQRGRLGCWFGTSVAASSHGLAARNRGAD